MANPRPTPKPGNLGPPWPPGTSGNMSRACSALPRDLVSVAVAAEQVVAHPQTLLTRSTFPVRYPVRHRKGAPDGKPTRNAETWESRPALATRHQREPCRLFPRPPPSGAQDDRWFVGDPLGLTPPGYELAPHTGLDKAPPRTRDEGRLDARATSHWSRIATQHRSYLPGAVTSA